MSVAPANFDRVARPYRWLEYLSFGPWLVRCRSAQLAHLTSARHALLLGDGDGRFLARLLTANSTLTADVVDSSQGMLTLLDRRLRRSNFHQRVRVHHADALHWHPTGSYDLVVSHFFLDCFFPHQLEQLFDSVLPHTLPGAHWLISEFAIPPNPFAAWFARGIIRLLYQVFGWTTGLRVRALPGYADSLHRRGLTLIQDRSYLAGLLRSQLWTAADLRTGGRAGRTCSGNPVSDQVLVGNQQRIIGDRNVDLACRGTTSRSDPAVPIPPQK